MPDRLPRVSIQETYTGFDITSKKHTLHAHTLHEAVLAVNHLFEDRHKGHYTEACPVCREEREKNGRP